MTIWVAICLWMIGQKMMMGDGYFVAIVLGVIFRYLFGGGNNNGK